MQQCPWYKSFGGDANYRKAMSKLMDRHRGVGAIVYSVERAIEAQFPAATEEEWHTVAHHIVYDVIHPYRRRAGSGGCTRLQMRTSISGRGRVIGMTDGGSKMGDLPSREEQEATGRRYPGQRAFMTPVPVEQATRQPGPPLATEKHKRGFKRAFWHWARLVTVWTVMASSWRQSEHIGSTGHISTSTTSRCPPTRRSTRLPTVPRSNGAWRWG